MLLSNEFKERMDQVLLSGSEKEIQSCAFMISTIVIHEDGVSKELFDAFIYLLRLPAFHNIKGSFQIIYAFEGIWGELTNDHKILLLEELEYSYSRFFDPMSCFVITEILGEYYADDSAFEVLKRLKAVDKAGLRSLIPHGFEHLASQTQNEGLSYKAYKELVAMKKDPSEDVRGEVEISIGRISSRIQENPKHPLNRILKNDR